MLHPIFFLKFCFLCETDLKTKRQRDTCLNSSHSYDNLDANPGNCTPLVEFSVEGKSSHDIVDLPWFESSTNYVTLISYLI